MRHYGACGFQPRSRPEIPASRFCETIPWMGVVKILDAFERSGKQI
jgi:hypothetical protein